MTDNRKEQERAALHATIWRIANDLHNSVDSCYFKSYVMVDTIRKVDNDR